MPGPASLDRELSGNPAERDAATQAAVDEVKFVMKELSASITHLLGAERKNIVEAMAIPKNSGRNLCFGERELRIVRYCLEHTIKGFTPDEPPKQE
jgi:hypothetical protein